MALGPVHGSHHLHWISIAKPLSQRNTRDPFTGKCNECRRGQLEKERNDLDGVPASMKNTLSAIYNRGLIGAFHDWRQPFSTYPRTYDLLHANRLFSHYKNLGRQGCELADILLEMDRMIRPQGFIIIRDEETITSRIQDLAPKFLWEVELHTLENKEKKPETVLICRKKFWGIIGNATVQTFLPI
ncbi:hypothetical protein ACFX2F_009267 [Malus domestica]